MTPSPLPPHTRIAFIGGGNMASAIIGGLLRQGLSADRITVIDPLPDTRQRLQSELGIHAHASAGAPLRDQDALVWAVKPQHFAQAAADVAPHLGHALQLSVMAGIRCAQLQAATGSARIVRCMPNTPALIGQGMSGLYAAPEAGADAPALAEALLRPTGQLLWVPREELLDAVTALSGSGPAYVFYFLQAMQEAGQALGLSAEQARQLACATFSGSARLAEQSPEPLSLLRERVTSKGGTTHAAITRLQQADVAQHFQQAMHAAAQRARELADEFGAND